MGCQMRVTVPTPLGLGRQTQRREQSRQRLLALIWLNNGRRRLPRECELRRAIEACDPRDVWWVCEMNSSGPVYFLPTREWVAALCSLLDELHATTVLEVAAGDGFLARCIKKARPTLRVIASDSGAWRRAKARMSAKERVDYARYSLPGLALGEQVQRLAATRAVQQYKADVVIVSWAPPGTLVERVIRSPTRFVIDVGTDGDACGNGARTWRFTNEYRTGPLQDRALCRLDTHPSTYRHSRVMLYYGGAHPCAHLGNSIGAPTTTTSPASSKTSSTPTPRSGSRSNACHASASSRCDRVPRSTSLSRALDCCGR